MSRLSAIRPGHIVRFVLMLGALLLLAGCTRGMSDLRDWVAQEECKKGAPIPPLPVIKTFETFQYSDDGKRDPSSASTAEAQPSVASNGLRPDEGRPKAPLEMFA